ncbi:hypothetical protein Tco_0988922 [Tanacetum coccineum]|uniref:Uncharacterized protein n=1 Tax=Tanacetum coccineum TaxID=301880 RepID=A0ABQ5ESY3_9ASTR
MAQQQYATDVHPDELCPPNKRYDLMDANKKVDLEHVQCPPESKILTEYHQEISISDSACSFFIRSMDLYGTVLAYFEEMDQKVSGSALCWDVLGTVSQIASDDVMKNIFNQ